MGFLGGSVVKNPPASAGDRGRFDSWVGKIPLEKGMATHSSILAWRIPWTEDPGGQQSTTKHSTFKYKRAEEPGGLQSMGSLRVGHD